MSKTVSARISGNLHEELRDRCNNLGCTLNEFVAAAIEFAMNGSVEFAFDPDEEEESQEPVKLADPPHVYHVKLS